MKQNILKNLYGTIVYHENLKAGYDSVKEKFTENILSTSYMTNNAFTLDSISGQLEQTIEKLKETTHNSKS